MVICWRTKGYIDQPMYKKLYIFDGDLPRSYGLIKVHKEGYPLRMIVSCINSPFFNLVTFLKVKGVIYKIKKISVTAIKNSFDFVKKN